MLHRSLVVLALLFLVACETVPKPKQILDPVAYRQGLRELSEFKVTGGLSVWTETESVVTRIEWKQSQDDFDLTIRLPAGLRTVQVVRQGGLASVRNGSTEPEIGRSVEVLLQQALGLSVPVPIEQMAFWIKGLTGDAAQAVQYDEQGRLASLDYIDGQSSRWHAKVLSYTSHEDLAVPSVIRATGGPYTVRLTLKRWSKLGQVDEIQNISSPTPPKGRLIVPGR